VDIWHSPLVYYGVTTLVKFVVLIVLFVLPMASVLTWMERRQSAYSQDRLGPHRAHFFKLFGRPVTLGGLVHVGADAIKMLFKEPFQPQAADGFIFQVAPAIGFVASIMVMSLIPFGPDIHTGWEAPWDVIPLQIVRVDTSLLLVFALGSLGIYGTALAGWSSNNKFALLGGLRASAQSVSYEIALGLTVVGMLMIGGSTELSALVGQQSGAALMGLVPRWGLFMQPLAAVLFFVAAMAETKRAPFDMPEGESEIIGYFVEYSSMGFGLFMLGEFVEVVVLAALFSTLFLGGWQLPWADISRGGGQSPWLHGLLGMAVFAVKVFLLCAFQLQVRWTLPRFRYDQVMQLGWKGLLPLSLLNIFVTALLVWWDPTLDILTGVGCTLLLLFALVVVAGPRKAPRIVPLAASH
jgi:NADH-quinone oxidoreductase subunit H